MKCVVLKSVFKSLTSRIEFIFYYSLLTICDINFTKTIKPKGTEETGWTFVKKHLDGVNKAE